MIGNDANVLFLSLFLGHILGDFFLQPDSWVNDKSEKKLKSKLLVLHALLHGLISAMVFVFLFWGNMNHPVMATMFVFGFVAISHWVIDAVKVHLARSYFWFIVDQALHVLILLILVYGIVYNHELASIVEGVKSLNQATILTIVIAYVLMLKPTAVLVGEVLFKWAASVETGGLENAGKYIGYIERILILTFVITSQYAAIGFILAAKSIFRMGDLKEEGDRKFTEYVMVGTLLSVAISLFCGLFIVHVLGVSIGSK